MDEKPPAQTPGDPLPENPSKDELLAELQQLEIQLSKITDRMRELLNKITQMDAGERLPPP